MANHIAEVAQMLGVEIGQSFKIELAIAIQCVANLVMGLTDLRAKKLLIKR